MFERQTSSLQTANPTTTNQTVSVATEVLTSKLKKKGSQCPHRLMSHADKLPSHRNVKI